MIKVILFDIDNVLIKNSAEQFSVRYSKDFGISIEDILLFINNNAKLCKVGKADLKQELLKVIDAWRWHGSVDELIDYWYKGELTINQELLDYIKELRNNNIKCYIASDNEKYQAERILTLFGGNKYFDGAYFSYNLGVTKADPAFFIKIVADLGGYLPQEILLVDDKQRNIDVAKSVGLSTYLYSGLPFKISDIQF